jgi:hypothetical protein
MATILPGSFLKKLTKTKATSDGHYFASKFPEKNCQKLDFWPFGLKESPQSGHFQWPLFFQCGHSR